MKDTGIPQSVNSWNLRWANSASLLLLWVALSGVNLAAPWADCVAADSVVWSQGPNLPLVYDEIRAAVLNGKLYVVGGRTGQGAGNACVNTVLVYDPASNQWSPAAVLPEKLGAVGLATHDGYLYCFGGINEPYWWGWPVASAYRYNPTDNSWTRLADMPIARSNFGIGVIGDKIYCAGGNIHWPNATSRVDVYDTATGSWSTAPDMPGPRGGPVCGVWAGKLVVTMGLVSASSSLSKTVLVYDSQSNQWTQTALGNTLGHESGSLFADSRGLYCMGEKNGVSQPTCISRLHPDTGQVDYVTPSSPLVQEGILAQAYDPVRGVCYGVGGWTTSRDSTFQLATISTGQPVATNYYWIITRGRDVQTAKAIYTLTPDGSNSTVLYQPSGLGPSQYITAPVLRTDGRLVFHLSTSGDCGPLYSGQLNTDQIVPLAQTYLDTPCGGITWIPGRDEVLFSNYGSGVHRMDLDPTTQDERRLTTGMYDEVNFATTQGVVYAAGPANPARMFTFDLNGGSVQPWDPFNNDLADWAFLSADQRFVAIRQNVPPAGSSLTVRQADANPVPGSPTPLVGGGDVSLGTLGAVAFSPDGQTLCFQRDQDLWSINIDGTGLRQLTHGEYPLPQVWGAEQVESGHQIIWHVNGATGSDTNNGLSWAEAKKTVQGALQAAGSADEIWVARGTYKPGLGRTNSFILKSGVGLYGGFAGNESSRDQRDWSTNTTIFSGDLSGNDSGFTGNNENVYHVITLTNDVILDGLVIEGGNANSASSPDYYGGGVYCTSATNVVLRNCVFRYNSANENGGAFYSENSTLALAACRFLTNSAKRAGGLQVSGGRADLADCCFQRCSTTGRPGGGIYFNGTKLNIDRCWFLGNSSGYGGGIYGGFSSELSLRNSVFSLNRCGGDSSGGTSTGGAFWLENHAAASVVNCTLTGNSDSHGLYAVHLYDSIQLAMTNCIIWNNIGLTIGTSLANTVTLSHCDLSGGMSGIYLDPGSTAINAGGLLQVDPLFLINADAATGYYGNLRLRPNSPCIDTGAQTLALDHDLDGSPRPTNGGLGLWVDIGAYEYIPPVLTLGIRALNGCAMLDVTGPVGANVTLQYTTNLANFNAWTWWASFTLPASPFTLIDCGITNMPQRFYRAITSR